jgi:hypothetical protein
MTAIARVPGLLVVEANAFRLHAEKNTQIADSLEKTVRPQVDHGQLRWSRYPVRGEADIKSGRILASLLNFDAVVIVGHGNPGGLEVAPGVVMAWRDVGRVLALVNPRTLLAISCFAGFSSAVDDLFQEIGTLDFMLGSPAPLTAKQAQVALGELLLHTFGAEVSPELSTIGSLINAYLTGGVVFRRSRKGMATTSCSDRFVQDLLSNIAWAVMNEGGTRGRAFRNRSAVTDRGMRSASVRLT